MVLRWLHISDVHENTNKDDAERYHRDMMHEAILEEVQKAAQKPDLVFFTGDLAFSGKKHEYELLKERLLQPLREALPDCQFFSIPGNHDVDRSECEDPRHLMGLESFSKSFQLVNSTGQKKRTQSILPRFQAYCELENLFANWGENWLASETGAVCKIVETMGKKLAIVGINTAWLCHDDHDWGKLTAGKTMVDKALELAKSHTPDLIIVLGHHPLAAMTGEQKWSDGGRIRTRLEQANAIYLHGHLHKSGGQVTGDSLQSVLAIQAPSGFQAADNDRWRNGIMWGEVDFETSKLTIEPKRWNDDFKAYVFDSDAAKPNSRVGGRDAFEFDLPGHAATPPPASPPTQHKEIAEGWVVIDKEELANRTATPPSPAEMAIWFDGANPRWELALAHGVRPRNTVDEVAARLSAAHHDAPKPMVVLLTGAGGEGKSSGLLQAAGALVLRDDQSWTCLWRQASAATLPEDLFEKLVKRDGHAWIVVIDDAETIAADVAKALKNIQPRTDIHILLGARETDWQMRRLNEFSWAGVAEFRRVILPKLDKEDALRITKSWAAFGDEAMGNTRGKSAEQAADELLKQATDEAAKGVGALLGGLLMTREGENLKERVARFTAAMDSNRGKIGKFTVLDIYGMIVAMHAENQLYLSRSVLSIAIGCSEDELEKGPLRILRSEAMVDSGSVYIHTRHRRIAEVARDWFKEKGDDIDRYYPLLAKAGRGEFLQDRSKIQDVNKWTKELALHFIDKGHNYSGLAVDVAKALFEIEPKDSMRITLWAKTLRLAGRSTDAMSLFRENGRRFKTHRNVLTEWSTVAAFSGDYGLSAWLSGQQLSDVIRDITAKECKLSLLTLGECLANFKNSQNITPFKQAVAACGRLGLSLDDIDARARKKFENFSGTSAVVAEPENSEADIMLLRDAVVDAAYDTEPENDPPFFEEILGDPEGYKYTQLRALVSKS